MNYIILSSLDEIKKVSDDLIASRYVGIDCETTGLNAITSKLRLIQFSDGEQCYIIDCFDFKLPDLAEALHSFLTNPACIKIGHNLKFDYQFIFHHLGIKLNGIYCTMLADNVLDFRKQKGWHSLESNANKYLGIRMDKSMQKSDWSFPRLSERQLVYAANDVKILPELRRVQVKEVVRTRQVEPLKLELQVLPVVAEIELKGFKLDRTFHQKLIYRLKLERDDKEKALNDFLNEKLDIKKTFTFNIFDNSSVEVENDSTINVRSSTQLLKAFQKLGVPIDTTDAKDIEPLIVKYPELKLLLDFREVEKTVSTYGEKLESYINPITDRIHCNIRQIGADTRRTAFSNPNLTNQPRDNWFRECYRPREGYLFQICVDEDTRVATTDGLMKIKDIHNNFIFDEENNSYRNKRLVDLGQQDTLKINTTHGYSLIATPSHRIRVWDVNGKYSWKHVRDLVIGDYVVMSSVDCFKDNEYQIFPSLVYNSNKNTRLKQPLIINEELAELFGYLVGDGGFKYNETTFVVSQKDEDVFNRIQYLLQKYFGKISKVLKYRGVFQSSICSIPLATCLNELGLNKTKIPEFLFKSPKSVICSFLKGFFEADGSIHKTQSNSFVISIASSREQIIKDIQLLLFHLDIISSYTAYKVSSKANSSKIYNSHKLNIITESSDKFKEIIGFISNRKNSILMECINSYEGNSKTIKVPNIKNKINTLDLHGELYQLLRNSKILGRGLTRKTSLKIKKTCYNTYKYLELDRLCERNQYFFKIESIENVGKKYVYDLTIPETSTFIGNGFINHNCDFANIELRIAADVSKDIVMLEAFENDVDLHSLTASKVFNIPIEFLDKYHPDFKLYKEKRAIAKTLNFGIVYGIGAQGLQLRLKLQGIDISEKEAQEMIDAFYTTYPQLRNWLYNQESIVVRDKCLRTPAGYLIRFNINWKDQREVSGIRRKGRNFPIQNCSAAITKDAIVRIYNKINELQIKDCGIVNVIHDEMLVEHLPKDEKIVKELIELSCYEAQRRYLKTVKVVAHSTTAESWADKE